jgi:hypothetical protein
VPWLLVERQWKMLANFTVVIKIASFQELGKTNNFLMSLFPTIITKEILEKNVVFTSFVGRIATIVVRT